MFRLLSSPALLKKSAQIPQEKIMAKMFYSGLVNTMTGRLGASIYRKRLGVDYVATAPATWSNPNTYRQQQIRANLTTLTKRYANLPDDVKRMWDQYSSMSSGNKTGKGAYIHLGGSALNASHAGLTASDSPPLTPGTPKHPTGFCVFGISTTCLCISWTKPDSTEAFVGAQYRLHYMFCCVSPSYGLCPTVGYKRTWRFVGTARSNEGPLLFTHDYPSNTRLYFVVHSIDTWGRKSPNSNVLHIYS
jgi:hypothetical protein